MSARTSTSAPRRTSTGSGPPCKPASGGSKRGPWSRPGTGRPGGAGTPTPAERHSKAIRLKSLRARLVPGGATPRTPAPWRWREAGRACCASGAISVLPGSPNSSGASEWESARLFLTADGERGANPGATRPLTWNPEEGWLEVKLPSPLAHLANRPAGGTGCLAPSTSSHRGDQVAAQAASGRHPLRPQQRPARKGRWYVDASWTIPPRPAPSLQELRRHPVVSVDVNAGHLETAVIAPDGNAPGAPATIGLDLAGLPAAARDGRLRAADQRPDRRRPAPRRAGDRDRGPGFRRRPRRGTRTQQATGPSRGTTRHGGSGGRSPASPPGSYRDRLTQMAANAGLSVVAVDPAYTSRWAAEHWLAAPARAPP